MVIIFTCRRFKFGVVDEVQTSMYLKKSIMLIFFAISIIIVKVRVLFPVVI